MKGIADSTGAVAAPLEPSAPRTVCDEKTAKILRSMLVSVVTEGIGAEARPAAGMAGGKTGTAQTGQYDENGEELLNYWFSGFYPAQAPSYTVTVLQDGILKPELSSAAIFEKITEILHVWDAAL